MSQNQHAWRPDGIQVRPHYGFGDGDPRVFVRVVFTVDDGRPPEEGLLDDVLFGHDIIELANDGIRTAIAWRDIERVEVVRP